MLNKAEEYLKKYFGHSHLREEQKEVIKEIINGRNGLIIMPTGKGKSLCYQLPSLMMDGLTVVISPLIALMKDQVEKLQRRNIKADFINSSLTVKEEEEKLRRLKNEYYKIIYIAPERAVSQNFIEIISNINISLIAVDEAHCISEWGHDFRPSYMKLKDFISSCRSPQTIALTATATDTVRRDIISSLKLNNPFIKITGFDRGNFTYEVKKVKRDREKDEIIWDYLCEEPGPGIIYCGTKIETEKMALKLKDWGIKSGYYHGGMKTEDRDKVQSKFMNNEIEVITATNAFGMGVDKGDIAFVIHYNIPSSIEAYYQEAGRAGRNGMAAKSLLLLKSSDIYLRKYSIDRSYGSKKQIEKLYDHLFNNNKKDILIFNIEDMAERVFGGKDEKDMVTGILKLFEKYNIILISKDTNLPKGFSKIALLKKGTINYREINNLKEREYKRFDYMVEYGKSTECRRKFILSYFGEIFNRNCSRCDNCIKL